MLKAVDFFAGAGGMTNGLLDAGIDVLAGVDNDPACKTAYERNNTRPCGAAPKFLNRDLTALQPRALMQEIGLHVGDDATVFVGCSPCQYWTKIRTSKEKSAATKALLSVFSSFVDAASPGYVVVENVPGLARGEGKKTLKKFLTFLSDSGYAYDGRVIELWRYGVPQKRERYVLLATRVASQGRQATIVLPKPRHHIRYPKSVSVRKAIGSSRKFPCIEAGRRDDSCYLHTASGLSQTNLERIRITPADGGNRLSWAGRDDLQLTAYRGRDDIFKDVYGRMKWDEPAPTITTRFISLSNGRFGHPEQHRAISLREGATLQTFPPSYQFFGALADVARQIGNAVPPLFARIIGNTLTEHFRAHHG